MFPSIARLMEHDELNETVAVIVIAIETLMQELIRLREQEPEVTIEEIENAFDEISRGMGEPIG